MNSLVCAAPAKLNLFLHVIGRRSDGYHLLESVFRFIDYGDTVTLTRRADGLVIREYENVEIAETVDLCLRAARLLQLESGTAYGVSIGLDKRLPLGGGLGGGSSDAASVLLGLNQLWELNWSRQRLQDLALQLGADVPVFIFGESAFAQGIGEILQSVTLQPAWYVVLVPDVHVSTPKIFASEQLTRDSKSIRIADFSRSEIFSDLTRNDLQSAVCGIYPEVVEALAWLGQFGLARMTGSGACVFAEFKDEQAARLVYDKLPADVRGFVAQGLDTHPLKNFAT
ncbi:4-(cytidine 5'-diphospho)-2-C-methyl-D-erythritol kinase [Sulfuriferula nivalis]|uniref:4-diphosphocytidyl-2-C-methyl-D-erythritol kinase n=1 Tax=Sulfuriferula nivalis TaxID=2675298 RepID=A0A809RDK1_9PROT|nr:4-(cytidine 5'-diphospho)-2-C-methyl-D-erythritol kinase [Sulfuriferula nivalis]BBO99848.1 4-diphosphocytidyl-2-C-methyl-D-erythritol kinase [Sulfuriferula nivalis]